MNCELWQTLPDDLIKSVMVYWSPRHSQKEKSKDNRDKMRKLRYKITNNHSLFSNQNKKLENIITKDNREYYGRMVKILCNHKIIDGTDISQIKWTETHMIIKYKDKTFKKLEIIEDKDLIPNMEKTGKRSMFVEIERIYKLYERQKRTNKLFEEIIIKCITDNIQSYCVKSMDVWKDKV